MDHKPESVLVKEMAVVAKHITVGGTYRHYRQQNTYKVLNLAINEADNDVYVIYQADYGQKIIFLRSAKVWLETVRVDGQDVPRFQKV